MKKYLLISLGLHIFFILFFGFIQTNQFGDEKLQKIVPITFVAKQVSDNPGSNVLANAPAPAPKKAEDKPKVEKKVEEKKIEKVEQKITKKETESRIADKNAKEVVKEEAQVAKSDANLPGREDGKSGGTGSGSGDETGNGGFGSNFIADGDGTYIALSSKGIQYQIINEVEPDYPGQAESIGYGKKVTVTVKFLVGLKGGVEKTEILQSHRDLGFDNEVIKAIKRWRFKPIYHNGKNIKVYFVKDFVFNPR